MICSHRTVRSKKNLKYIFCRKNKTKIDKEDCYNCKDKAYKIQKKKKYKKHKRTLATDISVKVKKVVKQRDDGLCIICLSKRKKGRRNPKRSFCRKRTRRYGSGRKCFLCMFRLPSKNG